MASFREMIGTYPSHKISMHHNVERNTEIDELNGAIVDLAAEVDCRRFNEPCGDRTRSRARTELSGSRKQTWVSGS
ncbi:hypothetical protein [Halocatena marina]|uniref:hypothetical protein n=1 Tax=Halocatena marina TaxID=2934937 RepID=UPI0034A405C9